jgi:hypothetical protein
MAIHGEISRATVKKGAGIFDGLGILERRELEESLLNDVLRIFRSAPEGSCDITRKLPEMLPIKLRQRGLAPRCQVVSHVRA